MDTFKYTITMLVCTIMACSNLFSQDTLPSLPRLPSFSSVLENDDLIKSIDIKKLTIPAIAMPSIIKENPVMAFRKSLAIPAIPSVFDQPLLKVANSQFEISYNTYDASFSNSSFTSDVAVSGIPVNASYHTGMNASQLSERVDFSSFKFDKDAYLKNLQDQLRKLLQTEDILKDYLKDLYTEREDAIKKIKGEISGTLKNVPSKYSKAVLDKFNVDNLSKQDPGQLLKHVISYEGGLLNEKKAILEQANKHAISLTPDSIRQLKSYIVEIEKSQSLLTKNIDSLQQSWMQKGFTKTLRSFDKEKLNAINELFKKPELVTELAEKHLKLHGLKKLLLNMRSIKTGASGTEHNDMIQGQNILKGVELEYVKKGKSFAPVIGNIQGIQNVNDLSYSNFNELANTFTSGLRMGKGDVKRDFSQVSFLMFQQTSNGLPGNNLQQAFNKNFVFSISRKISLGAAHTIQAEIAKSTMIYGSALQGEKDNLTKGLAGQNFFDNMGLDLSYAGLFDKIGLQNELTIRYKGNEYSSLGNTFAVNGTKEISNSLKKSFYNNRLIVNFKGQMREFSLGSVDHRWRNIAYVADIKLKYKKGEFIEVRLQPSVSKRIEPSIKYTASKSSRFSLRGNINRKVGRGFTYRNYIDLTSVSDGFSDKSSSTNMYARSLIITSLQNIQLSKRTLFINTIVNRASNNSGYAIFNSSLNLDAGTSYIIRNKVSLSSSLAYNHTDKLYSQIALRQSISAEIGRKMSATGYVNVGKNIKSYSSFYMPEITGSIFIRYTLN